MAVRIGKSVENLLRILFGSFALVPIAALAYLALHDATQPIVFGSIERFSQFAVGAVGAAFFIIISLGVLVLRNAFKPLTDLEEVTRMVARDDYSRRVNIKASDEFQSLGKAFNDMADQLEDTLKSNQSVADIDRLILSTADLDSILRKVLISARTEAVEVTLILRPQMSSVRLATYRLESRRLVTDSIGLVEITEDSLLDVDGYQRVAERVCGEHILECLPIATEGTISGVLVATSMRSLKASESKRLADLADRLSVAVTNIKHSDSLYRQAHFDALTGLINRHAFEDRLRDNISRSWRGEQGALLFIDLDGFKKVNDTEGHKAGDRLLVHISDRLRESLRDVDTIARLGGDEFGIIVPGCDDEKSVSHLCERIIASIAKPIVVDRMEHSVGASIGVALFPDDGQYVEELVKKADSAMYRAKELGGAKFAFFDDTLNEANRHRVFVETRLRGAIKRGELELHFQPKLKLDDRTVNSGEALLRWTDAELGRVPPDTFVPIAEETSLIHEFMSILVNKTADLYLAADREGVNIDHIAINASAKQLMTEGFAFSLLAMLDRRSLAYQNIELEITESVFARDTRLVVRELEILRSAGMKIALDDFGTGFSSLNMLRELPLDVVKIDRSFITELDTSDQARILVQHLISIAATLGKQVVAEGVETEVQLQHLVDAKCDYVQGYLIAKAKTEGDFISMLSTWQAAETSDEPRSAER
ncbi:MAG: EAL domain-containing protein [Gammaproteobacteria bacterium]|nr:EAL domain-containing protein [Gammaproteobacteria bacterium]